LQKGWSENESKQLSVRKEKQIPISCVLKPLPLGFTGIQNGEEIIGNTKKKKKITELPFHYIHHIKSLPTESQDWENMVRQKSDN